MDRSHLETLLAAVASGTRSAKSVADELSLSPNGKLDFAVLDTHRALRTGRPETIYGAGKTSAQIVAILKQLASLGQDGLVTRVDAQKAAQVQANISNIHWKPTAGLLHLKGPNSQLGNDHGLIGVVCAGTSDIPVAAEAAYIAEALGNRVMRFNDIGVAGLHRLLSRIETIRSARVLIVVAGMEGALPSVVAGLVDCPVIAVPTSVGYGANLGGITALLSMLNSCASGVSVVNIDNGYGAAVQASLINRIDVDPGT